MTENSNFVASYWEYTLRNYQTVIIYGFVFVLIILMIHIYNRLVRSWQRVRDAWSGIDVQLKQRANLIPNLVETVKGYARHESHVFEEVTRLRTALREAISPTEAGKVNQELGSFLGRLLAVAENYPQLKASDNFKELQGELSFLEEKIAYARQFYNASVQLYNVRIQSFPDLVLARVFHFRPAEFFQTEDGDRPIVKVEFGEIK
jgi:LemA protein